MRLGRSVTNGGPYETPWPAGSSTTRTGRAYEREHRPEAGRRPTARRRERRSRPGRSPYGREAGPDRVPRAARRRRGARRCRETWRRRGRVERRRAPSHAAPAASGEAGVLARGVRPRRPGAARCVHSAAERHARLGRDRLDERAAARPGSTPPRPRPGLDLDAGRRAAARRSRRAGRGGQRPLREPPRAHASPRCAPGGGLDVRRRDRVQHEDRERRRRRRAAPAPRRGSRREKPSAPAASSASAIGTAPCP